MSSLSTAGQLARPGWIGCLVLITTLAAACGDRAESETRAAEPPPAVRVGAENIAVVKRDEIRTGPIIFGELWPEREATVRAQLGGSVVQTYVEEGQAVRKGLLLARIEDRDLRDAYASARSAVLSAENALRLAESEAQRTEALVKGGALAVRDLEMTRNAIAAAQAQLADAKARVASVQQQLGDTTVRSPIAGIVSQKAANAGDVVTPGTALFTIIDPSSMRLQASVPSEALASLRVGVPVEFQVRGYPDQTFTGRIERISPVADPVTRQVPIFVSVPNSGGRLIAGLFAEGRVTLEARTGLVVPAAAVDTGGAAPWVLRVREGKAERVDIRLGLRDDQTERVEIVAGLAEGDVILVGAPQGITPGTPVTIDRNASTGSAR